jgi:hypothetical protein
MLPSILLFSISIHTFYSFRMIAVMEVALQRAIRRHHDLTDVKFGMSENHFFTNTEPSNAIVQTAAVLPGYL